MRKRSRDIAQVALVYLLMCVGAYWLYSYGNSSPPAGRTASPGDGGVGCNTTGCHTGNSPVNNSSNITLSGVPSSYVPGGQYNLTLSLTGSSRYGFEITAENSSNQKIHSSWTSGSGSTYPESNTDYLSHSAASSSGNWSFKWTAPSAGAGAITLYIAANISNNSGTSLGDTIHFKSYPMTEAPVLASLSPTFGSAGELITLSGTGFVGLSGSTITFGGIAALCTSGSNTSLVCPVPPGVASNIVSVIVTNGNGTSGSQSFNSIAAAPAPTAASPNFGSSTDTARTVTVTGSNFSKTPSAVKLTKSGQSDITGTGVSVANSGSLSVTWNLSGAATGQWNVAVTNPDSQTGAFSNGFQVQVLPSAPGTAVGVPTSTGSIHWEWADNTDNEDGFKLLTQGGATIATLGANTTFYEEGGLQGNALTSRIVRAFNVIGSSDAVAGSTYTFTAAPVSPAVSGVGASTAGFTWASGNAAGTTFVADIASGPFASTPLLRSSVTLNTSATFEGLTANTTHYFRVKARSYDNQDTAYTTEIATPTLANPPTGSAAANVGVNSLDFTWNPNSNPEGTRYTAQATSTTFSAAASSVTVLSTAGFSGLAPNTSYFLRVRAENHAGIATAFDTTKTTVTLAAVPGTPVAVLRGSDTLTMSWADNANPAGTLYTADMSLTNFGSVVATSATLNISAVFSGLTPSTSYYFRVRATDRLNRTTADTATGIGRTVSITVLAPTGVAAAALGVSSISWTWNAVALAASYNLYAASNTQAGAAFASGVAGTSFIRTALSTDTAYGVRVAAVNSDNEEGVLSSAVTTYTLAAPPTGSTAVVLSSVSVRVQWTNNGATRFSVERSLVSGSGYSVVGASTSLAGVTQYTDAGLAASTTYYYQVRGFNGDGIATAYDAETSTVTYPPAPAAPVLSGIGLSSASIRWSWTYTGAPLTSFTLFASTGGAVAALAPSATFYLETGLSARTSYSRYLRALNPTASAFSSTVTVATPDLSADVPAAAPVTLTAGDGATRLEIPSGALGGAGQAAISLDPVTSPLVPGIPALIASANTALSGGLAGPSDSIREFIAIVNGVRYTGTLLAPVTVRIPYTDADNNGLVDNTSPPIAADELEVYVLDETTSRWTLLPGSSVDRTGKTVSASINHLSVFRLLGLAAAADLASLKVFPNPWRPGSGGSYDASGVLFKNLTQTATIKIFTVAGIPVRTLEKTAADGDQKLWDGRNDGGAKVASGVYLYLVTGSASSKKGRLAVIR